MMVALPWVAREPANPDATYVAMASRLPLNRYRSVPGFMRATFAIRRQLAEAPGLVGYALDAELASRTFWTFSVWRHKEDLDTFAASDPHRQLIARLRPLMGESRFEFFPLPGESLPLTWDQMKAPLLRQQPPPA
jgi:hypothetical protein